MCIYSFIKHNDLKLKINHSEGCFYSVMETAAVIYAERKLQYDHHSYVLTACLDNIFICKVKKYHVFVILSAFV